MTVSRLLNGIVVETTAETFTGRMLYSDFAVERGEVVKNTALNNLSQIPFIGILAGITRIALGAIHTVIHTIRAFADHNEGHFWHAAKGLCEMLRGGIEAIPIIGRIFAWIYMPPIEHGYTWWMIKIYNPHDPDGMDALQGNWVNFRCSSSAFYVVA